MFIQKRKLYFYVKILKNVKNECKKSNFKYNAMVFKSLVEHVKQRKFESLYRQAGGRL